MFSNGDMVQFVGYPKIRMPYDPEYGEIGDVIKADEDAAYVLWRGQYPHNPCWISNKKLIVISSVVSEDCCDSKALDDLFSEF